MSRAKRNPFATPSLPHTRSYQVDSHNNLVAVKPILVLILSIALVVAAAESDIQEH